MAAGSFTNADVDASEDILIFQNRQHFTELYVSFVVGTANLTACTVEYKAHPDGGYFTVATAAGDYTTPNRPVLDASGDLNLAASGATVHWVRLDIKGADSVRIKAAGTSSTVTGYWGAQ